MRNLTFITSSLLLISFNLNAATVKCPGSPSAFEPTVTAQVSFDKKTDLYTYKYTIKNAATSRNPIFSFHLQTLIKTDAQTSPPKWIAEGLQPNWQNSMQWAGKEIKPGETATGFQLISKFPPGPTRFSMLGDSGDVPTVITETGDDSIIPVCPGFFLEGSSVKDDSVKGVTIGPVPPTRAVAKIRLKKSAERKWRGHHEENDSVQLSPLDQGKLEVLLIGDKNIDVSKIDIASLRFGPGEAKPIKTEYVGAVKEDCDSEAKEHLKNNPSAKHLRMEFNVEDLQVHCDLDRALFLTGKYEAKELFGAAKIKHVLCDKKTFSKEEALIKKDGRYKAPH